MNCFEDEDLQNSKREQLEGCSCEKKLDYGPKLAKLVRGGELEERRDRVWGNGVRLGEKRDFFVKNDTRFAGWIHGALEKKTGREG